MAILNGYRGNKNTRDDVAAIVDTYDQTLMSTKDKTPPVDDTEPTEASAIKSKTKTRVNRKGELIEKTKWKNTDTGRKGGSKKVTSPTTVDYDADVIAGAFFSSPGSDSKTTTPTPPVTTSTKGTTTPGVETKPETKPYVKPLKSEDKKPGTSYRDAYEKTDKSKPFEQFRTDAIQWNIDHPSSTTKGSITPPDQSSNELVKMKPRGMTPIKLNTPPVQLTNIESDRKVNESEWEKGKNKIKRTKTTKPPYNPRRPAGEYSTKSSTSCGKGGCIGPNGVEGMFTSDFTNKDRREINKNLRKLNRASRQDYRQNMADTRWHNRQEKIGKRNSRGTNTASVREFAGPNLKRSLSRLKGRIMKST